MRMLIITCIMFICISEDKIVKLTSEFWYVSKLYDLNKAFNILIWFCFVFTDRINNVPVQVLDLDIVVYPDMNGRMGCSTNRYEKHYM